MAARLALFHTRSARRRAIHHSGPMSYAITPNGVDLAFVPNVTVVDQLAAGALVRALAEWSPPFPGFYLYYSGRRQTSAALRALIGMFGCEQPRVL